MRNPINHAYGVEINSHANRVAFIGIAASIGCHYLGNRFIWQIASGAELLKIRLCQDVACLLLDRLLSNSQRVRQNQNELSKLFFLIPFIPSGLFLAEQMGNSQLLFFWIPFKLKIQAALMSAPIWITTGYLAQKQCGASRQLNLHRATLGVKEEATPKEITKAYRQLAKMTHSDKNRAQGADDQFKAVKKAYDALIDPKKWRETLCNELTDDNIFHSLSAFWLLDCAHLLTLGAALASETGNSEISQPRNQRVLLLHSPSESSN